jgi:starch synthase
MPRPYRVLMISSEVDPFARTGGLGDAVGGLSDALADLGHEVAIATPLYGVTKVPPGAVRWDGRVFARVGWGPNDVRELGVVEAPWARRVSGGWLRACLLDDPALFGRAGIYGDPTGTFGDNELRFVTLSRAALHLSERLWGDVWQAGKGPDIVHAHDWHAAPAVISAKLTMGDVWRVRPAVFTIHNLAYQGVLGEGALDRLAFPRAAFYDGTLAHEGNVNLMKGAIALADRVTAVSPTYAREIQTPAGGFGLDAFVRAHSDKLVGIVNGIDAPRFDPSTDKAIARRYDARTALPGRAECKRALCLECGLASDGPLFATVSRLTGQKGIDLLLAIVPALVESGARLLFVGQGEGWLELSLRAAEARYPGRVAARIAFDPPLARRVYAGADYFVVPSRFEPCGLTQMYAMRYGTIPIVTAVGGLRDTVTPVDVARDAGTGILAAEPTADALFVACHDALTLYRDKATLAAVTQRAMAKDTSWRASAQQYLDLYGQLARPA